MITATQILYSDKHYIMLLIILGRISQLVLKFGSGSLSMMKNSKAQKQPFFD
jgi:hypothetical protein